MYKGQPWTIADTHRHSRAITAELTAAKATPEQAWLGEVSAVVLQQAR